jgi:hypothetical protein
MEIHEGQGSIRVLSVRIRGSALPLPFFFAAICGHLRFVGPSRERISAYV